jgi:hypothetical protein
MVRDRHRILAQRLREIREELYGEDGTSTLAEALGIPEATWLNYEMGVTLPATVLLVLVELTGVNPHWLATGKGEKFTRAYPGGRHLRGGESLGPYLGR